MCFGRYDPPRFSYPKRQSEHTVTINGEKRGPEWGKGKAAAMFAEFRKLYEHDGIPIGQRTRYDLLGLGRKEAACPPKQSSKKHSKKKK